MAQLMRTNIPLLTVAIPTYNRAGYLDICLEHIARQLTGHDELLEVLVSNNNSTDNTKAIVDKYIGMGVPIRYVENSENIGAERNVIQCFCQAVGKYVLIIGDDDLLLDGALLKIIDVLNSGEYGVVYLSSYGFKNDHASERPISTGRDIVVYSDLEKFIRRVNYWVTFLSGNVVNKSIIMEEVDPAKFTGSNLPQLNWILSAMFSADRNAYIEGHLVAFKSANTGGYQLCQVFAVNMNRIFDSFIEKGVDKHYFKIINNALLLSFFPSIFLMVKRSKSGFNFLDENYANILTPIYKNYTRFWIVTYPIMKLPYKLANIYYKLVSFLITK